ncbi:uncharacterized protein LOC110113441 [Dendrobium catenatum]|uniref:DUF7798 domain-containing protein n=1 Tax=Dendrobium catenatum TaxID=906689 RepID=A0A2I0XC15_9ASPA|nr:uncharacterized protein LOC110113441 [Dendrobium catenatum]PKU85450.1 hypothetical protein MA16_Dca003189 [Dendrobium catenatum]
MAEEETRSPPTSGAENSQGDRGRPGSGGGDGGGGGVGWGGWDFSSFSVLSDLQKAASAAAQEISRNAAAVAKSITEIEIAEEDAKSDASAGKEGKEFENDMEDEKNLLRKSALDKLEKASEESLLGQGLKVIDSSVESLASGAWLAIGNALKGGSNLVHKLEHSAANLADSIQNGELPGKATSLAPSIFETGKSFTARGIEVLERVGKETIELLIAETGLEVEKSSNKADQHVDEEPFEEVTFDRCFYIYGGPDLLEELEALSSHYALLFNRRKAKLAYEQKSFYDGKLKQILQVFSLGSDPEESGLVLDKGKNVVTINEAGRFEMKNLRDSSVSKAADMAAGFTSALGGIAAVEMIQRTMDRLEMVHSEGVHRLSEFCCFGLSHLLLLGKSVISSASKSNSEGAEDDNIKIDWPEDSVLKSQIIRSNAQLMSEDVQSISNSFLTGIADIMEAYQAAIKNASPVTPTEPPQQPNSVQEKANTISNLLNVDRSAALEKIQDALKFLSYVVLSTSMPSM